MWIWEIVKRLFLMISILQIPYYSTIIQRPPRVWKRSLYKSKTQNEVILGCFTKIIRIIFVGFLPLVIFCLIPSLLNVMFGWFFKCADSSTDSSTF